MKVFKIQSELLSYLKKHRKNNSVGFIPTMGALHKGHLQLIKASKKECEITICSIFINPTQFNNTDDFKKYPNSLKEDLEKLQLFKCDIVYAPTVDNLYAKGESAKKFDFGTLAHTMEAKFRPGHFNGMATIVEKFFNIIKPKKAFFGQKDLQQLQIVKELVKQMNTQIEIISVPTVRGANGLAESSRNQLLSENAKNTAALIYNCLNYCLENKRSGVEKLKTHVESLFKKQDHLKLEYLEFVDLNSLLPIQKWRKKNQNAICIAASIDGVRLIDNIIL